MTTADRAYRMAELAYTEGELCEGWLCCIEINGWHGYAESFAYFAFFMVTGGYANWKRRQLGPKELET